jgi:CPA1 family monovalent cation:H+ antiporter
MSIEIARIGASVSAAPTVLEFFRDAGGGIAIGLAVGWGIGELRKRVTDVNTEVTISLFTAYGAFIPADQVGVLGVLAVVACGVYVGFRAPEIASPESRMQAYGLWSILTVLLNAAPATMQARELRRDPRAAGTNELCFEVVVNGRRAREV